MKTRNDGSLSDFTAWQWELAFVASRFRLGLLSDSEIIAFTHKLMDNGFYDNVMLDIIDDDPLFEFKETNFIKNNFSKVLINLNFPLPTTTHAKWLRAFSKINPKTFRPFNYHYFELDLNDYDSYIYDEIDVEVYEELRNILDTCADLYEFLNYFDMDKNPIFDIEYIQINQKFYQECENWLNRNQSHILAIMHQLFPKN